MLAIAIESIANASPIRMTLTKPLLVPRVRGLIPVPSNDNLLASVRPLSAADMLVILEELGRIIGNTIDAVAQEHNFTENPYPAISAVLLRLPELQRWIVWYGSNLKREEVDKLQESALVTACCEIIGTTLAVYPAETVLRFLIEGLRDFSGYLSSGAQE